jgi:hemerythrin
MPEIKWEDKFSVGIKELDEQHKKIIEIINRLSEMKGAGNFSAEDLFKIIQELSDYAQYHFTNEEIYFREFDYPETEAHIREHEEYRLKIKSLKDNYSVEQAEQTIADLLGFIDSWWIHHINHADKEYTECFHQHGLY